MTSTHFLVSACISAVISADELPTISNPWAIIRHCLAHLLCQSLEHKLRGPRRRHHAEPTRELITRHPRFIERRNIRQQAQALLAANSENFELAAGRHGLG